MSWTSTLEPGHAQPAPEAGRVGGQADDGRTRRRHGESVLTRCTPTAFTPMNGESPIATIARPAGFKQAVYAAKELLADVNGEGFCGMRFVLRVDEIRSMKGR
jgi:hypothetical protein